MEKTRRGNILPPEVREGLLTGMTSLHLSQKELADESRVSQALVSKLLSGSGPVTSRSHVSRIAEALENRVLRNGDPGFLEENGKDSITATIQNLRSIFGLPTDIPGYTYAERAGFAAAERSQRLREKMVESMLFLLEQNAQIAELVRLGITEEQLMLAALRMTEMFSQTARVMLEQHGDIFFPKDQGMESGPKRGG